ncbi:MAG: ATP-binding cassette domain-containing protein [Alphaproteobacteria bacterium]|nr:MAG: ATP-binding cassette domain-containing protein [Alphaproteobacteria bacterium]
MDKIKPNFATTRTLMRRLARDHIKNYKGRLGLALCMMVIIAATTATFAKLIEPILDKIFIEKNEAALWPIGLAVIVLFAVRGLATYGEAMLMNGIGQGIIRDLQNRMFRHVVRADLAFFHGSQTGALVSRFTYDVGMLRYAVANTITGMGKDILTLIFLMGMLFYQDAKLAFIALVVFPLTAFPIAKLGRKVRKLSYTSQGSAGTYASLLEQVFHGMRHVKANNTEDEEVSRAEHLTENLYILSQRSQRYRSANSPIMEFFGAIAVCAVIIYGGYQVIDGYKTTGAFFSFITALLLAYEPLKGLAKLNAGLQEGMASAQRIYDLLEVPSKIVDAPDAKDLELAQAKIEFRDVEFSYDNGKTALWNMQLDIPAGRTTALVGPSGGGKSTILNLIPRFYDVSKGSIVIDGQNVRDVTLHSLRDAMALVSQETLLFDDTIRANIAYGQKNAGELDIIQAAKAAGAHEFIMSMPNGYDTPVGPQGSKLSGGQRQRVAIARAMLKNAPILLLDEATSALDSNTERQVQSALQDLMRGRTTIVIAHRLSTIVNADLIYVIDQGWVVESGTHQQLLAKGGAYAKLYSMQYQAQDQNQPAPQLNAVNA